MGFSSNLYLGRYIFATAFVRLPSTLTYGLSFNSDTMTLSYSHSSSWLPCPNLRLFSRLGKLNLNFVEACGRYHDGFKATEENYDFPYYGCNVECVRLFGRGFDSSVFVCAPVVYEGDGEVDPDKVHEEIDSVAAEIAEMTK